MESPLIKSPIAGTMHWFDAGERIWDVVVIGAGPAGCVLTHILASRGIDTLLVEREQPPRPKVCGGCISAGGLRLLGSLGLANVLESLPHAPLAEVAFCDAVRSVVLPLPAGMAVNRATLDAALLRAAIVAGGAFLPQTTACVVAEEPTDHSTAVELPQRRQLREVNLVRGSERIRVPARVVVVAAGLSATATRQTTELPIQIAPSARIGFASVVPAARLAPAYVPLGRLEMMIGRSGYVGLVNVEQGNVGIAGAVDRDWLQQTASPAEVVRQLRHEVQTAHSASTAAGDWEDVPWQVTGPLTRRCLAPAAHRLLAIGDATGYEEPFTGEGVTWAIELAGAAAPLIERGLETWTPELTGAWEQIVRRHERHRRRASRWLKYWIREPWRVRMSLAALGCFPAAGRLLAQQIAEPRKFAMLPKDGATP